MSQCEYRRDLRGGELVNFMAWTPKMSFEDGIEALRKEMGSQSPRAILFKSPPGFATEAVRFATPKEAIEHILKIDPARMCLRERVEHTKKMVDQQAAVLEASRLCVKLAKDKVEEVSKESAADVPLMQWMYADCATGVLAYYDPLRWSRKVALYKALEQFENLAKEAEGNGKPQRPVLIKIRSGLDTKEGKFENYDAIVAYLQKQTGGRRGHFHELAKAVESLEEAQDAVVDAETNLSNAMKAAEEAERAAAEKGESFISNRADGENLAKEAEGNGKPQRPVLVEIQCGSDTKEGKFENYDAIVDYLQKQTGGRQGHLH